ncbi:unnamed protein product [Prunus brigantina]
MSTTGREWHSVLRIFKGRRGRTGHHATCGALPAAWTLPPAEPFPGWAGYLHRRPLRRARAPGFAATAAPSYSSGPRHLPRRPGIGRALKRHPFSGLVDSAGRGRCAPDASNHWLYPIELVHGLRLSRGKLRREPATRRFD